MSLEHALAQHVGLADTGFFGGRAIELDRAARGTRFDRALRRDGGCRAGGAEHAVAAAVSGRCPGSFLAFGRRILRQPGQRVVLGEDANRRPSAPIGGDERRRHAGNAFLHRKAVLLQDGDERLRRSGFLQARFRVGPDVAVHPLPRRSLAVEELHGGALGVRRLGVGGRERCREDGGRREDTHLHARILTK
jgi:hypothetical protein